MFAAQGRGVGRLALALVLRLGSSISRSFRERVSITPAERWPNHHRTQLRFLRRPHGCGRQACVVETKNTPTRDTQALLVRYRTDTKGVYAGKPLGNSRGRDSCRFKQVSKTARDRKFLAYGSGFRRSGSNSSPFNNSLPARLLSLSVFLWTSANSSCRMNCNSRVGGVLAVRQSARRRSSRRRWGTNISTAIEVGAPLE
jgi:hypothetical protein